MSDSRGGLSDALVVRTSDLAVLVREFIEDYDRMHPKYRSKVGAQEKATSYSGPGLEEMPIGFGGINFLAHELTSMNGKSLAGASTLVRRIVAEAYQWTVYSMADEILTAMNRTDLWSRLRPVPNPRWGQDKWVAWKQREGGCDYDEALQAYEAGCETD